MPIYEYQCRNCNHQLEVIQKVDEPALVECPKCQQATFEKKISAAGFQLKGTGWYVTDFKESKSAQSSNPKSGGEVKSDQSDSNPSKKTSEKTIQSESQD